MWLGGPDSGSHEVSVKMLAKSSVFWLGESSPKVVYSHGSYVETTYSSGFWQRPELLPLWISLQSFLLVPLNKQSKREQEGSCDALYHLVSGRTHHNLCDNLLVTETNYDRIWKGTTQKLNSKVKDRWHPKAGYHDGFIIVVVVAVNF